MGAGASATISPANISQVAGTLAVQAQQNDQLPQMLAAALSGAEIPQQTRRASRLSSESTAQTFNFVVRDIMRWQWAAGTYVAEGGDDDKFPIYKKQKGDAVGELAGAAMMSLLGTSQAMVDDWSFEFNGAEWCLKQGTSIREQRGDHTGQPWDFQWRIGFFERHEGAPCAGKPTRRPSLGADFNGVSLTYLVNSFERDVTNALGEDSKQKKFYELKDHFWMKDGAAGFLGSRDKICPRDGRQGCAIVDALDPPFSKTATHFVSWCWGYTVGTMLSSLDRWRSRNGVDADAVFLWICFFCNNQRLILIDQEVNGSDDLAETFQAKLTNIGQVVIVLDQYESPTYVKRIWTVFEIFTASSLPDVSIEMAMPETQEDKLLNVTVRDLQKIVKDIDAESAEAWCKADEDAIKDIIRKSELQFAGVNTAVKTLLTNLLTKTIKELIKKEYGD